MAEQFFRVRKGLTVANTSASANLDPITLTIGGTVVNTTVVNVATVLATSANASTINATTINAATHQVGTLLTANSTLVNAAAINVRGQTNTVTFFATTSANVGANVQLTTVQVSVGNSTANLLANSILVKVANSTGTANLQPTQLVVGTSVVNSTAVNAAAIYYGGVAVARLGTEDQVVTGGARVTEKDLGTISSGTVTPDPGDRAMQYYTNNGAHTLAPGANYGCYMLTITNGASAGAITTSGWTKKSGDEFATTSGYKFRCHCSIGVGGSLLIVQAMQ